MSYFAKECAKFSETNDIKGLKAFLSTRNHSNIDPLNVNYFTDSGTNALLISAEKGHTECLQTLIEFGFDLQVTTQNGITPLAYATFFNNFSCVKSLIDAGALHTFLHNSSSLLHLATAEDASESLQLLLDAGISIGLNIHQTNRYGDTALHNAVKNQAIHCLTPLLKAGLDVNQRNYNNKTPTTMALSLDNAPIFTRLIEAGADLQFKVDDQTLLEFAVSHGSKNCLPIIQAYQDFSLLDQDHPRSAHSSSNFRI